MPVSFPGHKSSHLLASVVDHGEKHMTKLIHGGDIYTAMEHRTTEMSILDYSANINPLGLPEGVKAAAAKALDQCANYPDPLCRKLRKAVAQSEQVQEDWLAFGNGAADLIFRLAVAQKPKKALVLAPTFAEYEKALELVQCEIIHHLLQEERGFHLTEAVLSRLDESVDMMFLCNPNNPTGQLPDPDLVQQILDRCRQLDILLVVDECFIDFVENRKIHTLVPMLQNYKNLVILKAFTKNYAMPGLRLGYCLSQNEGLLNNLFEAGQPWAVSLVAQEAGIQALNEKDYLEKARTLIFTEKKWLCQQMKRLGFQVFYPAANYIFFRLSQERATEYTASFQGDLEEAGILVRSCENYKGLQKGFFRIAVKTHEENRRLMDVLAGREEQWQKRL